MFACASEDELRRKIRHLSHAKRIHSQEIHLSVHLFTSPLPNLQHSFKSHNHTMSYLDIPEDRVLSVTKPVAREHQDDIFDHYNEKSSFHTLCSTTDVAGPLPLTTPVFKSTLPSPQPEHQTPGAKDAQAAPEQIETQGEENVCNPGPKLADFHAFGNLPPELRIKIWHLSFLPRVVELHSAHLNHAAAVQDDGGQQAQPQQWQSGCSNPAALSVCSEAREIAVEHFRIAYPLASIAKQQDTKTGTNPACSTMVDGKAVFRRRVLYISPEYDTVALCHDTDSSTLSTLLDSFRDADRKGKGISSLALSTSGQVNDESVTTNFDTTVLRELDQLILFPNGELSLPCDWSARGTGADDQSLNAFRRMGNRCELVSCKNSNAWYVYKQWRKGKGRQFWDSQRRILQVGKNRIRIQDLEFSKGWQ